MKIRISAFFGSMAVSSLFAVPLFIAPAASADEPAEATPLTVPEAIVEHESPLLIASLGFEYVRDATVPGQEAIQKNIPLGLTRATDDYILEIFVPYIQRTAPSGKVARSHHHESAEHANITAPLVSSAGLGDITTSLQLPLTTERHAPLMFFARGEIKFATADVARGLGTGANDYSVELIAKHAADKYRSEVSVGYANLGSPGTVEINDVKKTFYYRNIYFGSVSGLYRVADGLEAGVKLEMGQAAENNGPQQRDFSAIAEYRISTGSALRVEILKSVAPGLNLSGFSATILSAL